MTSQKDIQSLIADIDSILPKVGSRLPWSKPSEATRERQVLERIRRYLVSLQPTGRGTRPLSAQPLAVQEIVQAVNQELEELRAELTQPLQAELAALREQRESLKQEIQQLQQIRQQSVEQLPPDQAVPAQRMSDFAQALINQSTERLTQQLSQVLMNLDTQLLNNPSSTDTQLNPTQTGLLPQERLEQLRQIQAQFDQMLITLDANHRTIFEALQRNLYGYQESLAQSLDNMHRLGLQGEMVFAGLINRLAQQLGRDPSTLLQQSGIRSDRQLPKDVLSETIAQGSLQSTPLNHEQPTESNDLGVSASIPPHEIVVEHQTQDWEPIQGSETDTIDIDNDSDRLETFIQLQVDEQDAFSTASDHDQTLFNPIENPELDWLFSAEEEEWPEISDSASTEDRSTLGQESAQLDRENPRPDIDDFYESLFGTEALIKTEKPDESPPAEALPLEELDPLELTSSTDASVHLDAETLAASGVEEVLFEGVGDPAPEMTSDPSSLALESTTWETVLFDDSASNVPPAPDLTPPASTPSALIDPVPPREPEPVETVAALTDLLDQMGLSYALPDQTLPPTFISTEVPVVDQETIESDFPSSVTDDLYIPASPDEDLLAVEELINEDTDPPILFDQMTLEQLSRDLDQFEELEAEETLGDEDLPLFPDEAEETFSPRVSLPAEVRSLPPHPLPMSEELLAEDWEEFALHHLSQEGGMLPGRDRGTISNLSTQDTPALSRDREVMDSTEADSLDSATPAASGLVDSDLVTDRPADDSLDGEPENRVKANHPADENSVRKPEES